MRIRQIPTYQRVLRELEEEIRLHPDYADLRNQRGLLMMTLGDLTGAKQEFLNALRLNPKYREAAFNLGYLYLETKRWKEAEAIFFPEAKRNPGDDFLQTLLGIISLGLGREKEAALKLHRGLGSHPGVRTFYQKKGMRRNGKVHVDGKAANGLHEGYLHRRQALFHQFIGLYLAREGKSTQAVRELKKAAKLVPDAFQSHFNLGIVYYYQGAHQKAVEEFNKAIEINPKHGMGYAYLSYVYGLTRRTREALRSMKKAVRLNPRYADLRYSLALLYSDRKQYREAVSELKRAVHINPNYLFARFNLGILYEDQKRWKEAKREYERILRITPEDDHVRNRLKRILPPGRG
jgi:superkiller protein 3